MKTKFIGAAAAVALLALSQMPAANAALITTATQIDTVAIQSTSFVNAPLTFDKFDSGLGTLISVNITLDGTVSGTAGYENEDNSPATITLNLEALLTLTRPGGGAAISQALPVANIVDNADAFDGVSDRDGTSGATFAGLSASANDSDVLTSPADLALFTAAFFGETITLELDAFGTSNGSGAGNLALLFSTNAGATATVSYTYDDGNVIGEPATLALLGAGLIGAGLRRRRKA
jgi:hypothetical protein